MKTFTAFTTLPGKDRAEQLGEMMERLAPEPTGIGVFEVEDGLGIWEVGGYFTDPPDVAGLALISIASGASPFVVSELPETDWVAHVQRELVPVQAGRFFVYGSHNADNVPKGATALLIEASMAFGTGHHGTTTGCLLALDKLAASGFEARNVADIGCGTAVLAMAAARLWSHPVLASDIDQQAVDVARANVAGNGLEGQVICVEAAGFDHPKLAKAAPFDLVFANILKGPLIGLAGDMRGSVCSDGYLILSGILEEQSEEIIAHYADFGFNLVEKTRIVDWSTLIMRRKSA